VLPGEIPPRWEALAPEPGLPRIRTSEPDEYAHGVLAERHPALIEQVRGAHPYGPGQHAALDALATEITVGRVAPLPPGAPDATAWDAWMAPYLAGSWFDLPFLVAEAFFYRRLLEAVGYTRPGPWQGADPFAPAKAAELAGLAAADTTHDSGAAGVRPSRADLLLAAVWGNQADLGFLLDHGGRARPGETGSGLLVDASAQLWQALAQARAGRVLYVADNAGQEITADLLLVDRLIADGHAVTLHVKPTPTFVSDATVPDVVAALAALAARGDAGHASAVRLREAARAGALDISTHWFWTAPYSFHHLPADLVAEVRAASFVLLKGDLNYRRLLGDLWWPPTADVAAATAYLPAPVGVLRTLKSDVVAGLPADVVARLERDEPGWRTSGRYAVIQLGGGRRPAGAG
jgi:hypothetical protein